MHVKQCGTSSISRDNLEISSYSQSPVHHHLNINHSIFRLFYLLALEAVDNLQAHPPHTSQVSPSLCYLEASRSPPLTKSSSFDLPLTRWKREGRREK